MSSELVQQNKTKYKKAKNCVKTNRGGLGVAQQVKCLLLKHEELNVNPNTHIKSWVHSPYLNPSARETETDSPLEFTGQCSRISKPWVQGMILSQRIRWRAIEKDRTSIPSFCMP